MLSISVFPIISLVVFWLVLVFAVILGLRMLFSFTDPNPFGFLGKFAYRIRRLTDRYVQPFATFLFMWRIDKKWAPILTFLVAAFLAYFGLRIIEDAFLIIDGLIKYSAEGNAKAVIGFLLYALLSIFILFVFLRVISSWFVYTKKTFFGFVRRVTDPVMIPFQKLIPPIGMIDISAMILLVLLQLLQNFILRAFVF